MKKNIVILGATGSIGVNAIKVAQHLSDELQVFGVAAYHSVDKLAKFANELNAKFAVIGSADKYDTLKNSVPSSCQTAQGQRGLIDMVTHPDVDMVLCAITGTAGLFPVLEAIRAGKDIAIASKEVLVMGGELVMEEVKQHKVSFLPVDSEHSAISQCLDGKHIDDVSRLILTASGGPFKDTPFEKMKEASYECALAHPTWNMGPKVTVDSATMMNKALEIIEAKWLFDIPGDKIDVIVHPQSVVHSMVEFIDGTILAQMSTPDMRFPIQYALTYPVKHPGSLAPLDFAKFAELKFELPDKQRFPSLELAYQAMRDGGTMPAVMNAANEVAVDLFAQSRIKFTDIWNIIEKVMSFHKKLDHPSLDAILSADSWARIKATELVSPKSYSKS